jgi:DNA-binding MarR family transcriptional regulator
MEHLTYGYLIEKTGRKIKQELQKEINRLNFDITVDQWVLLFELYQYGSMVQVELAERTFKDAPTITRIIELLLQKHLILKHASKDDRRKFIIDLSDAGKALVEQMHPHIEVFRKQGWRGLSLEDWAQLQRICNIVFHNFDHD